MGGIIHGERCGVVLSRALLPMSGTIASRPTDDRSAVPPFLSRSFAPNLSTKGTFILYNESAMITNGTNDCSLLVLVTLNRHKDSYTRFNDDGSVSWYKNFPNSANVLRANVHLADSNGTVTPTERVNLDAAVVYEDGTIPATSAKPILFIREGSSQLYLDESSPSATIYFRILACSSNHKNRRFKLRISALFDTAPESKLEGLIDTSILVKSRVPQSKPVAEPEDATVKSRVTQSKPAAEFEDATDTSLPGPVAYKGYFNILTQSFIDGLQADGCCVLCGNKTSDRDFFHETTHLGTCRFVTKMLRGMKLVVPNYFLGLEEETIDALLLKEQSGSPDEIAGLEDVYDPRTFFEEADCLST